MKFTSKQEQNLIEWYHKKEYKKIVNFYRKKDIAYCLELPFTRINIDFVENFLKCKRCGKCCTIMKYRGKQSNIRLMEGETKVIAKSVGIKERTFKEYYCKKIKGDWYLKSPCKYHTEYEMSVNQDCKIYPNRPSVCRMFPLQNPKQMKYKGMKFLAITLSSHCPAVKSFLIKQWLPELQKYKMLIQEQLRQQKEWIQSQKKLK